MEKTSSTDNRKHDKVDSGSEAENVSRSWGSKSLKTIVVSGVGFLADAYDLFVIDFVKEIMSLTAFGGVTVAEEGLITSATLAGAVIGQLGFGVAADFIGRKVMFISTASLVIFGSIASALVGFGYQSSKSSFGLMQQLALCRFLLGIGIGGEYPLAATVASEAEVEDDLIDGAGIGCWYLSRKPNSIACVFSMQGVGMLLSPLLVLLCIASKLDLESTWRLCLGLGALPSAIAFYYRWQMQESSAFKKSKLSVSMARFDAATSTALVPETTGVEGNLPTMQQSQSLTQQIELYNKKHYTFSSTFSSKDEIGHRKNFSSLMKHLKRALKTINEFKYILLGTSLTWFLIDVTFYGTGSFKSTVVGEWFKDSASSRRLSGDVIGSPMQLQRRLMADIILTLLPVNMTYGSPVSFLSHEKLSLSSRESVNLRKLVTVSASDTNTNRIFKSALMGAIVACISLPGYVLSVFFIHKTGLKRLQLWGFLAVALSFFVLCAVQFMQLNVNSLEVILLGLTFLFTNFGPNTTTFILPTTVYPTFVRATCHGFSAAMGKLGGVVGTALFKPVLSAMSLAWVFFFCGIVALIGCLVTVLFVPNDAEALERLLQNELGVPNSVNRDSASFPAKELGIEMPCVVDV